MTDELSLRYGMNPQQAPARAWVEGKLPISVRNGEPSYINLLDALNGWQLVREMSAAVGLLAAASIKHVSPAGAAVAGPLTDIQRRAFRVDDLELSDLATAYARARGADRLASFGDVVALSHPVDLATARLIGREVSDGVVAPGFAEAALEILSKKKSGQYLVLEIDPGYTPPPMERRDVFGVHLEQSRGTRLVTVDLLRDIRTKASLFPPEAERDLLVALIVAKYTQSNSVVLARQGQAIGVGAGQQSRVACVRLAAAKAALWHLRQHPRVLGAEFAPRTSRAEQDNAIDAYVRADRTTHEDAMWRRTMRRPTAELTADERREWLGGLRDVALASDGFLPFRDSVDVAASAGVRYIAQPGGSARDDEVIAACDEQGVVMAMTRLRLFHH